MTSALDFDALAPYLQSVEARLAGATSHAERTIDEAASHLARAGGKRMRPMLVLLAAHLGEGINDDVERAAVGVELTHLATLYHDDVMDSAALRRGAPAAHEVWGNTVAILTGDLLFARASREVAALGAEAVRIHAETFERLCLGQLHETLGPEAGADPVAHYISVLADKTGSLIATSARYGAMFAHAPEAHIALLEHIAAADVLEAMNLIADRGKGGSGGVGGADEGADELATKGLEAGLEGEETTVVLDEDALVVDGSLAHIP